MKQFSAAIICNWRKPYYVTLLLLLLLVAFYSCNYVQQKKTENAGKVIIDIQPFSDISKDEVQYVFNEIKKIYPYIQLNASLSLPVLAYNTQRNRYRADSLINYLNDNTPANHVSIGLTTKDISTTKNNITDWGVMGLGFCPGNACVVSTFRLTKEFKLMQLFKVAIHELGHTEGLPHCPVSTCFMRDAEGKNPTNEEKEFCPKCKAFLINKGWQFQ